MYKPETLQFLADLKENNNKTWFDSHKKQYDAAREDHLNFTAKLIAEVGKWDDDIKKLQAKDCVYRIYRDVRFSKDKTPYKSHFGTYLSPGGKKSARAGYYFHLEPEGTFLGGGVWEPQPEQLKNIRQEIDYNLDEFESILQDAGFAVDVAENGQAAIDRIERKAYDVVLMDMQMP
ncbi:MAG: TIGR02453 family protein, partial [Sphingobacteriales bacterium]